MSWSFCPDVDAFIQKRRADLYANESLNCLAWAAISRSKKNSPSASETRFLTYEEGPVSTAHAFVDLGTNNLVLSPMSKSQTEELKVFLEQHTIILEQTEGPQETTLRFAEMWSHAPDRSHRIQMNQGLYELRVVQPTDHAGGQMIPATQEHSETLAAFLHGFVVDCFPEQLPSEGWVTKRVERLLDEKKGYIWLNQEGEVVSMAAIVRESPNTSSISLVYTPPKERGQGYAASLIAALSQAQLDAGKTACNLHTDLANPTSNGVYIRIGYQQIRQSIRVQLMSTSKTPSSKEAE